MIYLKLFLSFFKIGLFTFGGGYAMIPLIQNICLKSNWLSEKELLDFIAISESTPGPVAINMATFIGSSQGKIIGSICATIGVILPSFIIILIISKNSNKILKNKVINSFLKGIKPCIVGLILATAIVLGLKILFNISSFQDNFLISYNGVLIIIMLIIIHLIYKKVFKKNISPIIMILISGLVGMIIYSV